VDNRFRLALSDIIKTSFSFHSQCLPFALTQASRLWSFRLVLPLELASPPVTRTVRVQIPSPLTIFKPQHLFAYGSPALAEMAASYAAGIILNHPFLDGNKRIGFMLAATFLEINGMEFTATEESVVQMTLAFADGKLKQAAYAEWLSKNARAS